MSEKLVANDKITKAIVRLQRDQPFFAYVIMHLKFIKNNEQCKTMGVDAHGNCMYNDVFVESLEDAELQGTIVHESLHVGLCHLLRLGKRSPEVWNIAADLVVNDILVNAGIKIPKGALLPNNHSFTLKIGGQELKLNDIDKKNVEEVYDELKTFIRKQIANGNIGQNGEGLPGGFDNHIYVGDDITEGMEKEIEANSKQMMVEARNHAHARGKVPAGMERIIERLLPPKLNWRYVLQNIVTSVIPSDFTYRMPHRKSIACGTYLPTMIREEVDVIVTVDTSGSISQDALTEFISEIVSIGRSYRGVRMTLISHDAAVQSKLIVDSTTLSKVKDWKPKGGGGTSHVPVWSWIKDNVRDPKMVICFTDGDTDFGEKPPFEVVWILRRRNKMEVPFGKSIMLPADD